MGDELGGLGSFLIALVVFITVGSAALMYTTGLAVRRTSERRRRQFTGEAPLPTLYEQISRWIFQEGKPVQDPPEDDFNLPNLDYSSRDSSLPAPDIDEIIGGTAKRYSEGEPEPPREGEVVHDGTDDDWAGSPEPVVDVPASMETAITAQVAEPLTELPADAVEVLRVYRDLNDGTLIFHMNDQLFVSAQQIQGSPLTKRFSAIVKEMNKIVGNLGGAFVRAPAATATGSPAPPRARAATITGT